MGSIPKRLHDKITQKYKGVWEQYDDFIKSKGSSDLGDWPSWCYMPMAGAYAVVSGGGALPPDGARDISKVAAVAAWRPDRAIIDLREASVEEILETSLPDNPQPSDFRLPVWCPFVQLTDQEGVFLHLEHDMNDGHAEFRALYIDEDLECIPLVMDLRETLQEGARTMVEEGFRVSQERGEFLPLAKGITEEIASTVEPAMALCVYLRMHEWNPDPNPPPRRTAQAASEDTHYRIEALG